MQVICVVFLIKVLLVSFKKESTIKTEFGSFIIINKNKIQHFFVIKCVIFKLYSCTLCAGTKTISIVTVSFHSSCVTTVLLLMK